MTPNFVPGAPDFGGLDPRRPEVRERERSVSEDAKHQQETERYFGMAAAGKPDLQNVLQDPENRDLLYALPERQSDGSVRYVTLAIEKRIRDEQLFRLQIEKRIEELKGKGSAELEALLKDVRDVRKVLQDAATDEAKAGGSSLSSEKMQKLLSDLDAPVTEDGLKKRMDLFVEMARYAISAPSTQMTQRAIADVFRSGRYAGNLGESTLKKLDGILSGESVVSAAVLKQVLDTLKDAAVDIVVPQVKAAKEAADEIATQLATIDLAKRLNVIERFGARQRWNARLGGPDANSVVNFSVSNGKIDFRLIQAQLKALKVDVSEADLRAAAGIATGDAVPKGWDSAKLVELLENSGLKAEKFATFNALGKAYEAERAKAAAEGKTLTWKEYVSTTARDLWRQAAISADLWWEWMKTLPSNVINGAGDKELLSLIEQEEALGNALTGAKRIQGWSSRSSKELQALFDGLATMQGEIDLAVVLPSPARGVKQHVEQSEILLNAAKNVLKDLNASTNYVNERNPRFRKIAFYLAMRDGIPAAEDFLKNPPAWLQAHADDPIFTELAKYQTNVNRSQEMSGRDVLDPLRNTLGLEVHPQAIDIMKSICGPANLPLSADQLLTNPAQAAAILDAILTEYPPSGRVGGKQALVSAFLNKVDVPGVVTSNEAMEYVRAIYAHLNNQAEQSVLTRDLLSRPEQSRDWLNSVRAGVETLGDMWRSGDRAEQLAAAALTFGGIYAIYKAWKAGGMWRNALVGVPMILGLDIAVKRATGKGVLDRLNINFMSQKDRNSAYEQFIRTMRNTPDYAALDSEYGREAMRQLMSPEKPIPIESLLRWRECVLANGQTDFSAGAPQGVHDGMRPVLGKLGIKSHYDFAGATEKQQAYRAMFLAFEAFCVRVAEKNGLGGTSPQEKAAYGANLIRSRHVNFDEPFLADLNLRGSYEACCMRRPGKCYSMFDVFHFELGTPALDEHLENTSWTEWIGIKLGVAADKVKEWSAKGYTWAEMQAMAAKEKAPEVYDYVAGNVAAGYEGFMKWAKVSWYKGKNEVVDDVKAMYDLLSNTLSGIGVILVQHGPGVAEWTLEKGIQITDAFKTTAINAWREMYRHHFPGDLIRGFEKFYQKIVYGEDVKIATAKEVAEFPSFFESLQSQLEAATQSAPNETQLHDWIVELANGKEYLGLPVAEQLLLQERMKREIFSLVLASRIAALKENFVSKQYDKPLSFLRINWKTLEFDGDKFIVPGDVPLQKDYEMIRSKFTIKDLVPLMGSEKTITGLIDRYAKSGDSASRTAADFAQWMLDWVTSKDATEFQVHDMAIYVTPLLDEAAREFGRDSDKFKEFAAFVETLVANVMFESALDRRGGGGFRDTRLLIKNAQTLLKELSVRRGEAGKSVLVYFKENDVKELMKFTRKAVSIDVAQSNLGILQSDKHMQRYLDEGVIDSVYAARALTKPGTPKPEAAPKTPAPKAEILDKAKKEFASEDAAVSVAAMETLLKSLSTDLYPNDRVAIHELFDEAASSLPQGVSEKAVLILAGANDPEKVKMAEARILEALSTTKELEVLTNFRKKYPEHLTRIQHTLDRGVIKILKLTPFVEKIASVAPSKLPKSPSYNVLKEQAFALYEASNPPNGVTTDVASQVLEFVLFQGWHDYPDEHGYKNVEKYVKALEEKGLTPPPVEKGTFVVIGWYGRDSAYTRLMKDASFKDETGKNHYLMRPELQNVIQRISEDLR